MRIVSGIIHSHLPGNHEWEDVILFLIHFSCFSKEKNIFACKTQTTNTISNCFWMFIRIWIIDSESNGTYFHLKLCFKYWTRFKVLKLHLLIKLLLSPLLSSLNFCFIFENALCPKMHADCVRNYPLVFSSTYQENIFFEN